MENQELQDELFFIKKIIEESRRTIVDDGLDMIFWGLIVTIGLILTYIFATIELYQWTFWIWPIIVAIGWLFPWYNSVRLKRKTRAKTFALKILAGVWLACGIGMTLIGFVGTLSGAISGYYVSPTLSIILGIGYFITGFITDDVVSKITPIGWWLGSIIMFIFPGLYSLLLMAGMMFFFQTIPGIIIYKKFKQHLNPELQ